jgi:hypothetical protein
MSLMETVSPAEEDGLNQPEMKKAKSEQAQDQHITIQFRNENGQDQ